MKRSSILDFGFWISRAKSAKVICRALCALLLAAGVSAEAQQQAKLPKIGWLVSRPSSDSRSGYEVIRRELSALGHHEGKNLTFEHRYTDGKLERLPALVDELLRLRVDLIVASTLPAARAAKHATKIVPIVFLSEGDPVVIGLVASLARPGGNVTGFTNISPVIAGKRLELLKETVPKLSRVAVLWTHQRSDQSWEQSQAAARDLGLRVHSLQVDNANQFNSAFKEATNAGSGALAVTPTPVANANRKLVIDLAAKNRLPAIYPSIRWADEGGLISYGADESERYKRVAVLVDKILKGAKPTDLPVEQPKKFDFVINLKTAQQISLTIPPNVLARADKVIK